MLGFDAIDDSFGLTECHAGLFYNFEWALRIDLGGDIAPTEQRVARFTQAYHRAVDVVEQVFSGAAVSTVVAAFDRSFRKTQVEMARLSRRLAHAYHAAPETVRGGVRWRVIDQTSPADRAAFIWASVAAEIGVAPRGPDARFYFVDQDMSVLAHVYDDRGMDVVAHGRAALQPHYGSYVPWLLKFDRSRMDAAFG